MTTTLLSFEVQVTAFQFGSVPAPPDSHALVATAVPPKEVGQEVFWFDRGIVVPAAQTVRFNLRFEVNVHNSANLQVSVNPATAAQPTIEWRWSAPVGYTGLWSASEQQAPWFDDQMDYCINIQPDGSDISVTLSEHAAITRHKCAFIPPQAHTTHMVRPA